MSANQLRARRIGAKSTSTSGSDDSTDNSHLHLLTIALALLAGVIFTLVEHNDAGHAHSNWCTIEIIIQSVVVLVGSWFARRYLTGANALVIPPLLLMAMLLSLLCEPIQRSFFGTGHPFEELIMHCQSNVMLALATCSFRRSYRQLCVISSLFLTIFCLTKTNGALVVGLFSIYAVLGVVWLIASHWEQVSRRAMADTKRRLPIAWFVAVPVAILLAIVYFGGAGAAASDRLKGFMPSSGGTEHHHDHAHGGVKDGDGLVAGKDNIQSFGPIEDAPFADDDKPSLYDAFDDTFDEPMKIAKITERAVAVPPEDVVEVERRMARSKQAGREFSTLRRKNDKNSEGIKDLDSTAMFYVAGRTPVHFRMQFFDVFDGIDWIPEDNRLVRTPLQMAHTGDRHWLNIMKSRNIDGLFGHRETHAVKIINLKGNMIPSPPHTAAVSINQVDRVDFYKSFKNGLIALDRENLPSLTPIQVASNRIDSHQLKTSYNLVWVPRTNEITTALPVHDEVEAIRKLADEWTRTQPRGPEAIAAITNRLRTEYTLDRSAHADEDSEFPVADFLFRKQKGPEYMFATAAAVMLRTQGYPTRLVGGFYARPEKYQATKRHTPVHTSDAHFWCEVNIGSNQWITVEPSPGYEILMPPPGLLARLRSTIAFVAEGIRNHPWLSLSGAVLVIASFWNRRRLADFARTAVWKVTQPSNNRSLALRSLRLLERRFDSVGMKRPLGTTFGNWIASLTQISDPANLRQFAAIANRAAFGSGDITADDRRQCEQLVEELTFSRIRRDQIRSNKKERP